MSTIFQNLFVKYNRHTEKHTNKEVQLIELSQSNTGVITTQMKKQTGQQPQNPFLS